MDYLRWIFYCINIYTYKKIKFVIYEKNRLPFEIGIKSNISEIELTITPERILQLKDNDISLKAFLEEIIVVYKIEDVAFLNEVFQMVRTTSSPLYFRFLQEETSPWGKEKEEEKLEYPVTFNFEEFHKKLDAEVKAAIEKTKYDEEHNIPITISVDKVKLTFDRQGNLISGEGDATSVRVTGTIEKLPPEGTVPIPTKPCDDNCIKCETMRICPIAWRKAEKGEI